MQLILTRRVSRDTNAVSDDVRILKKALNRLSFYTPEPKHGITNIADGDMIDALKKFQEAQGLKADGILLPGDDTTQAMNKVLTSQEGKMKLIWHCVNDGHSCKACQARSGTAVDDESENTPGCLGNCRCWVTHEGMETSVIYDPGVEAVYPIENLLFAGRIPALYKYSKYILGSKNSNWKLGEHKSTVKWKNQFEKREWTNDQVTNTIRKGKKYPAPNMINPLNKAIRYEYDTKFVVRDEITNELLQVSKPGNFEPSQLSVKGVKP